MWNFVSTEDTRINRPWTRQFFTLTPVHGHHLPYGDSLSIRRDAIGFPGGVYQQAVVIASLIASYSMAVEDHFFEATVAKRLCSVVGLDDVVVYLCIKQRFSGLKALSCCYTR